MADRGGASRPYDRRRAGARAGLRPAGGRGRDQAGNAAGEAGTRVLAHRLRRFIDAIGAARTRELFLLGKYIDAQTALQWGLVNRVAAETDLEASTLELAGELAGNAPLAQLGNKRVIAALLRAEGELEADVEQESIELRARSFASRDMREGMRAFAQKRAPEWRGE